MGGQMNMMTSNMNQMNITERPVDLMNGRENLIGPEPYAPRPIKYQARGFGMFQKKKTDKVHFYAGKVLAILRKHGCRYRKTFCGRLTPTKFRVLKAP